VEFLREAVPGLARTAVLVDPANPANVEGANSLRAAAEATGVHVETVDLGSANDLQATFETSGIAHAQAVYVQANPVTSAYQQLSDLLIKQRLPAIALNHTGVLISYGPDHFELERQGATYATNPVSTGEAMFDATIGIALVCDPSRR
jgi:putative ABC transport system substrate-binding protein